MEAKKTENADLTKKSAFFFSIGLLISMTIVVTAFEWKDSEQSIADLTGKNTNTFEETVEYP